MFSPTRSSREGKPSAAGSFAACGPLKSFVAIGDSFTEGLNDELRFDGRYRGWADRVAEGLVERQSIEYVRYANLAVRGRLSQDIVDEQVPVAVDLQPDLVTIGAGVNDALRRGFELDTVAGNLETAVRALRGSGAEVLIFAFGDPSRRSRILGTIAKRLSAYRSATLAIAEAYECPVVDFWGLARFDDERLWSADRLHLSPIGHQVTAEAVWEALGLGGPGWRAPAADPPRPGWTQRRAADAHWIATHAGPWIGRRARGVSSGAGITAKDPQYRVIHKQRGWDPQRESDT